MVTAPDRLPSTGPAHAGDSPPFGNTSLVSWIGRVSGPLLALAVYGLTDPSLFDAASQQDLSAAARATAAIGALMAVWWMTEALPLPVTSLLPVVLFPLTGVLSIDESASPYANKYVFLFLGGFLVARAVERWNLHRRIALLTVSAAGPRPRWLIAGFMVATGVLSMWISNTASTVMMLPIGMSLVTLMRARMADAPAGSRDAENFATAMMLGIAYSASIGGTGTLIGTPTNALLAGFADDQGITIGFGRWMLFALPLSIAILVAAWLLLTFVAFPVGGGSIPGGRGLIRDELRTLGRMSRGEVTVLVVFVLTALAWVMREPVMELDWLVARLPVLSRLSDTTIALIAAISLFLIPIDVRRGVFALDWETARSIPWGVLLLFGGGFSLAHAVTVSGLAEWIGGQVSLLEGAPLWLLILAVTTMVVFLTELTSNTPTAAAFLPILYSVALGLDIDPLLLLAPATIAASMAFMLPVATPPNAIVFGSGCISIGQMVKAGVLLNLLGIGLIVAWMIVFGAGFIGGGNPYRSSNLSQPDASFRFLFAAFPRQAEGRR